MNIRPAVPPDYEEISAIFARARAFMAQSGNPDQWRTTYPPEDLIRREIDTCCTRVCEIDGRIQCVFSVFPEGDPCYDCIWDGQWLDDSPYCAVHRVASRGEVKGIARDCLRWCLEQYGNIRIDTHADNRPMQHILEKVGFTRCGRVLVAPGEERIAYQCKR